MNTGTVGDLRVPMLALIVQLTACQEASSQPYVPPAGWQTFCLDRLLLDVPEKAEPGTSTVSREYGAGDDTFSVQRNGVLMEPGIEWGGVTVTEVFASDAAKELPYDVLYDWAVGKITSKASYDATIRSYERDIHDWTERSKEKGTPEEHVDALKFVAQSQKEIEETRFAEKVSGIAKLSARNAFAIRGSQGPNRAGDGYTIGYLDPSDQGVRLFAGIFEAGQPDSPQAAASQYTSLRSVYHPRQSSAVPTARGYCTSRGLFDEADNKPLPKARLGVSFSSSKYPSLLFKLEVSPPSPKGPWNIQELPYDGFPFMLEPPGEIKRSHGPTRAHMAGQPARIFGREYGTHCYNKDQCERADEAYVVVAETLGEPGGAYRPAIKLHMAGVLNEGLQKAITTSQPRPSVGAKPPPFDEAMKIFDEVVRSIRVRPGAVSSTAGSVYGPQSAASAMAVQKP